MNPLVYLTVPAILVSISAPYGEIRLLEPGIFGEVPSSFVPNEMNPFVLTYVQSTRNSQGKYTVYGTIKHLSMLDSKLSM